MGYNKKIYMTVCAETGYIVDSNGDRLAVDQWPIFSFGNTNVLCVSFVDSDNAPFPLSEGDAFEFSMDKDFIHTVSGSDDPLMAHSGNDQVDISGDWADIDRAGGKISVRASCNTPGYSQKIGSSESVQGWVEIKRCPVGASEYEGMLLDKCTCKNAIKTIEGAPESADPEYCTATQVAALLATKANEVLIDRITGQQYRIYFDNGKMKFETVTTT